MTDDITSRKKSNHIDEIDAALNAVKLLFLESFLTLAGALLYILLATTRLLRAIALFVLALASFCLWCFSVWETGLEVLLNLVTRPHVRRLASSEVSYGK